MNAIDSKFPNIENAYKKIITSIAYSVFEYILSEDGDAISKFIEDDNIDQNLYPNLHKYISECRKPAKGLE